MIEEDLVELGDDTPKLQEQARLNGWRSGIFNFGKAQVEGTSYFNPGLVQRPDGLWLVVRRSINTPGIPVGKNDIVAFLLDPNKVPQHGAVLQFPESDPQEHFEDPRAIYWNHQVWVGATNFTWFMDGSWTGAHQVLGIFKDDPEWTPLARRDPPVETNRDRPGDNGGFHQKNWVWFFHEGKLHLLYMSDPWKVVEFGASWDEQRGYGWDGVQWKYGQVRGGTPPIIVDDLYWTFFHSSLPWRGRYRRYYMGALAFEARPPFTPVKWTQQPLLAGSQNDVWAQRKPLVVFPCGSHFDKDMWLVTYGINDLNSGWVEIPHEDVAASVAPAPVHPATKLAQQATKRPVYVPIPYVERDAGPEEWEKDADARATKDEMTKQKRIAAAARARAAKAAKRQKVQHAAVE